MLLTDRIEVSINEYDTCKEALDEGIRLDGRDFNEGRRFKSSFFSKPGFVRLGFGGTTIAVNTTAKLIVPSQDKPNRGFILFNFQFPPTVPLDQKDQLQTYFRCLWRSSQCLEENSLCIKPGEKVWQLTTTVLVEDDDSGLVDLSFAAALISLNTLRFPSFNTDTGMLFPPSLRRSHKIAFALQPFCVTVAFLTGNVLLVDPTLLELQIAQGYVVFIFDEWMNQVFMDAHNPGDIDAARDLAIGLAKQRKEQIEIITSQYHPHLFCVGEPADFAGYQPPIAAQIENILNKDKDEPIDIWQGEIKHEFHVATASLEAKQSQISTKQKTIHDDESDWLMCAIIS